MIGATSGEIAGNASRPDAAVNLVVQIERRSVHASDEPPSRRISVSPDTTLRALVALASADRYLPDISGGKATWVVESSGAGVGEGFNAGGGATLRPVAVCAQQWAEVTFLVAAEVSVATHFGAMLPKLNFSYRAQQDPDAVVAALATAV